MTKVLEPSAIAAKIKQTLPDSRVNAESGYLLVEPAALTSVLTYLKTTPGLEFDYLSMLTAVDYWDYFELVYVLDSLSLNQIMTVKTRLQGRVDLWAPSVVSIYQTADYQERETFETLGIRFSGHPDLRPFLLWEGFQGNPLRKDYL
ncbi:MAG TPA: NADH-quinone oxidoreductase subunit C [Dehalococcoidales bacterium]|nr:NADH-quinone oxidoreductase subunit C [Dehalococcoidales bacterium]